MLKKSIIWPVFFYGIIIIALGFYGYHVSGSKISLWTGTGFGTFLVISAFLMFAGKIEGAYLALLLTFILTALFVYRYIVTMGMLPAAFAILGGGMLLFLLVRVAKWRA